MIKKEFISIIEELADLLEFTGDNPFKISAYRNGAAILQRMDDEEFELHLVNNSFTTVKGIGKGLNSLILEFHINGEIEELSGIKSTIPESLFQLFEIRGIGAKKISLLYNDHKIDSLETLERFCLEGKLEQIKGFGAKLQQKVLEEINRIRESSDYHLLAEVIDVKNRMELILNACSSIDKYSITGTVRRQLEVHKSIEFVLLSTDTKTLYDELIAAFNLEQSIIGCDTVDVVAFEAKVVLYITNSVDEYYKKLVLTTGSEEYLSEINYNAPLVEVTDESSVFDLINQPFFPAPMREKELFLLNKELQLPSNLTLSNLKGLFHFHTQYSDGKNTIFDMVKSGLQYGFEYAVVCDHSKTAFYAGGLTIDKLAQQRVEIENIRNVSNLKVFQGIESDILRDGSLDYDEDILKQFTYITASIHSITTLNKEEMTSRIIKAVENQYTDAISHPTGRILLHRNAYEVDMIKVLDACAANSVAIEINANTHRLDLDWRLIYHARNIGCKFTINADAHSNEQIAQTLYGVLIAQKGGITTQEVINCYSFDEFTQFANRKVKRF